ncbi:MAG: MaoC family dehydratase N-terminal domain-containing protein [Chloroflexota bacterium]
MTQKAQSALTPAVKAMIGKTGDKVEAWWVVDEEYLRRLAQAVPDWDPRFWDEAFAKTTRFKTRTVPPMMARYIAHRKPLWEKDTMDEVMEQNPKSDGGGGMRTEEGSLPRIPTHLIRHLHGGDEMEVYQCPKIGDKLYFQRKYADIQERVGGDGNSFLILTISTTYWNQNGDVLCKVSTLDIRR